MDFTRVGDTTGMVDDPGEWLVWTGHGQDRSQTFLDKISGTETLLSMKSMPSTVVALRLWPKPPSGLAVNLRTPTSCLSKHEVEAEG